jgi:hypothetical protein
LRGLQWRVVLRLIETVKTASTIEDPMNRMKTVIRAVLVLTGPWNS